MTLENKLNLEKVLIKGSRSKLGRALMWTHLLLMNPALHQNVRSLCSSKCTSNQWNTLRIITVFKLGKKNGSHTLPRARRVRDAFGIKLILIPIPCFHLLQAQVLSTCQAYLLGVYWHWWANSFVFERTCGWMYLEGIILSMRFIHRDYLHYLDYAWLDKL